MRVTRAIREYVEEEISKKYHAVIDGICPEYRAQKDAVEQHVKEIMRDASREIKAYLDDCGYQYYTSWRCDDILRLDCTISKSDDEDRMRSLRSRLNAEKEAKIKQVLFDLELGSTEKAQLKDVLDSIVISAD